MNDGRQVLESAQHALETAAKLKGATIIAFCSDGSVYVLHKPRIKLPVEVSVVNNPRDRIARMLDKLG